MIYSLSELVNKDKHVLYKALRAEKRRQRKEINLIASENYVSQDVLNACGSIIQNKYAEGYAHKRYYMGCENVDIIEDKCNELIQKIFHAAYSNCQPHSGSSANFAAYSAACKYWKCKPQDVVGIGFDLNSGGHLTHFNKMTISGDLYNSMTYGLTSEGVIDYKQIETLLKQNKDKHIILNLGYSAYPLPINYDKLSKFIIRNGIECVIVNDVAHIAGLIAAGLYENPLDFKWGKSIAILTSTTHKTLRCARHAFIATNNEEMAKCIDKAVFPYLQGGPLVNMIAGVAMGLSEVQSPKFVKYQKQVLANMKSLIEGIKSTNTKIRFVLGGSNNHLCLLNLKYTKYNGKEAEQILKDNNIVCNRNTIVGDKVSNPMGLRLGTAYMTSKGWNEKKFYKLGQKIGSLLA